MPNLLSICFLANVSVGSPDRNNAAGSDAWGATMSRVRITVLGRLQVTVDGEPVLLTPTNARTLVRLAAAGPRPVLLGQLYRDVWRVAGARVERRERTLVQRQISKLRQVLGARPGVAPEVILTERNGQVTYRLAPDRVEVDLWRFEDLARQVETAADADLIDIAEQALALCPAETVAQFDEALYPPATRRRLVALRAKVQDRQLAALTALGHDHRARELAAAILDERPDCPEAVEVLRRGRPASRDHLHSHTFAAAPGTAIVLAVGDLFAFPHADLVIGFTDTFDTSIRDDRVISAGSAQGQLLTRLYPGTHRQLDRVLRRALSAAPIAGRETRPAKPHGKLVRYPIGTVATIRENGRRIFCVAYSRLDNDLVARSSVEYLTTSLDRLWEEIHRKGAYGEVVMPLVGSGRSRISALDRQGLLELIVTSFHRALVRGIPICRELRIVLDPAQREHIDLDRFRAFLTAIPEDGSAAR